MKYLPSWLVKSINEKGYRSKAKNYYEAFKNTPFIVKIIQI